MMTVQTETRKLAAVMFTDIEGYTSMFHSNESKALDQIANHRRTLEEITSLHNGQIIQYYGDGSLVIFDSVIDAIDSAIDIQKNSQKQQLPVRIGIHMGDLVIKEGNIFGDVVNIASRIQSIGIPGSVIVSRKIINELGNHPEIRSKPLGHFELKNIKEPQELFAITGSGLSIPDKAPSIIPKKSSSWVIFLGILGLLAIAWFAIDNISTRRMQSAVRVEKIAVPPFENFTANREFNPVSQMAAHWITTELIELAEANVVSYPSSAFYSNTSEASMPLQTQFAKQTGAINIIKGAFSLTGVRSE